MADAKKTFRDLIGRFPTGVAVVAAQSQGDGWLVDGLTVNSLTSVSLDPLMLLFCLGSQSRLLPRFSIGSGFSVNLLSQEQIACSRKFAGQHVERDPSSWQHVGGIPMLVGSVATFVCRVSSTIPAGDHHIVLGEVEVMHDTSADATPLVYFRGQYRTVSHGVATPQ